MVDKQLHLSFGTCGPATMYNCHTLTQKQLEHQLNETKSIALLARVRSENERKAISFVIGFLRTREYLESSTFDFLFSSAQIESRILRSHSYVSLHSSFRRAHLYLPATQNGIFDGNSCFLCTVPGNKRIIINTFHSSGVWFHSHHPLVHPPARKEFRPPWLHFHCCSQLGILL